VKICWGEERSIEAEIISWLVAGLGLRLRGIEVHCRDLADGRWTLRVSEGTRVKRRNLAVEQIHHQFSPIG